MTTSDSDAKFAKAIGTTPDVVSPVMREIRAEACELCKGAGKFWAGATRYCMCEKCNGTGRKPLPSDAFSVHAEFAGKPMPSDSVDDVLKPGALGEHLDPEPFSESDGPLPLGDALAASCAASESAEAREAGVLALIKGLQELSRLVNDRMNIANERIGLAEQSAKLISESLVLLRARVDMLAADVRRMAGPPSQARHFTEDEKRAIEAVRARIDKEKGGSP